MAGMLLMVCVDLFSQDTMKTMRFEPYKPIPADEAGLLATVGNADGDYAPTLHLAIELIFQSLKQLNFTGEVEFYSSANDAQSQDCQIGLGFHKPEWSLTSTDWPKWQKGSMESIRQKSNCCGAVQYLNGEPITILEHRPVSPFIKQMGEFCDPSRYIHMDDPVAFGYLTEIIFLELPERAFVAKDFNGDGFELAGDDTRLIQWLELPGDAKGLEWYVFRNKAHYDSFIGEKAHFQAAYPLKATGHDPFYIDSPENLRRQREIVVNQQKASLAGGVKAD